MSGFGPSRHSRRCKSLVAIESTEDKTAPPDLTGSDAIDPKLTSPPQMAQWVVASRSAAQEKSDLFEEPIGSRLMLQEQMVLALEGDEAGAGNASRQLPAGLNWNNE